MGITADSEDYGAIDMFTLPTNIAQWLNGIAGAIIGGAATAGGSWLSLLAAKEVGLAVPTLNLKALGSICLFGSLTNLFFYLKSAPTPFKQETTQVTVTKTTEGTGNGK